MKYLARCFGYYFFILIMIFNQTVIAQNINDKTTDKFLKKDTKAHVLFKGYKLQKPVINHAIPTINNSFLLEGNIKEITLVIRHEVKDYLTLILPNGEKYPLKNAKTYQTSKYSFITIKEPMDGVWQLHGVAGKNKNILILNNLVLTMKPFKQHLFAGQKTFAYASLTNNNKRINEKALLDHTSVSLTIGKTKKIILNKPNNYEVNYRKEFYLPKDEHGNVDFIFKAKSKTFKREKTQKVMIEKYPFNIDLRKKTNFSTEIHISTTSSTIYKTLISGFIKYPTKVIPINLKEYSPHKYFSQFKIDCLNNQYEITVAISGKKIDNSSFELEPIHYIQQCPDKSPMKSMVNPIVINNLQPKETFILKLEQQKQNDLNSKIIFYGSVTTIFLVFITLFLHFINNRINRKLLTKSIQAEMTQMKTPETKE